MSISTVLRRTGIALAFVAGTTAAGVGTAGAATVDSPLPQPTVGNVKLAGALPNQNAENGKASATATNAIALGASVDGGKAVTKASGFGAPAAIAVGPNSHAEAWGNKFGPALAIAGPNSTVKVSGKAPAYCEGEWGLAGDFQTLTGCVVYPTANGSVQLPLDARLLQQLHK
ncbi:DUF6764 family protein [Corynebacterium urogenitale]